MSDGQLWELLKEGQSEALELIYQAHVQDLYDYGMHIQADSDLVKDAIQDLFVHIWQRRAHLGEVRNIHGYLAVGLRNRILETVRMKKKWRHQSLESHEFLSDSDGSYENEIILQETLQKQDSELIKAIEKLPSKHREIIHLLFYKNLSQEQVSKIMSITMPSVYTLTWKATKRLRKHLENRETAFAVSAFLLLLL